MKAFLPAILILLLGASISKAETAAPASQSAACAQFVQKFYDWYLATENAQMKAGSKESAEEVALREKQSNFSPALVKGLKEDRAAAKKNSGEIVGLDFDPFLNSQESPSRCVVGKVTSKDGHYRVEVFVILEKKKSAKPDVTPELVFEKGHWVFTNFHYGSSSIPANENLVSVLQQLKKDRTKK